MTLTRKYYNDLIDILGEICKNTADSPLEYINIRKELFTKIRSIQEFYLFELTFSSPVLEILCSDKITDFEAEKLILVNELQYELNECLWVTRLRYGGELMQYSIRIQLALLNLSLQELKRLELIKKDPKMNFLPESWIFKSESDKQIKVHLPFSTRC